MFLFRIIIALTIFLLAACRHDSNDPTIGSVRQDKPADVSKDSSCNFLNVTDDITLSIIRDGPLPPTKVLTVTAPITADDIDTEYKPVTASAWLRASSSKEGPFLNLQFDIKDTNLDPGSHDAVVHLKFYKKMPVGRIYQGCQDIYVNLSVQSRLAVSEQSLEFSTILKSSETPGATLKLYGGDIPWHIDADQNWLNVLPSSGTGTTEIQVTAETTGSSVPAGRHNGNVQIVDDDSGETIDVPVTLDVEPYRLFVADNGVGLSSSHPNHTLTISDNAAASIPWLVQNDATWLSVEPISGVTGDNITLTADGMGLPNGFYSTTLTIIANGEADVSNQETINVGFYVSDVATSDIAIEQATPTKSTYSVADPVRPFVYLTYGDERLERYDVYTGQLVDTLAMSGSKLRYTVTSTDGKLLFAFDSADDSIKKIDLDQLSVVATWTGPFTTPTTNSYLRLYYTRMNGYSAVLTSSQELIDAANGDVLATVGYPGSSRSIATTQTGKVFIATPYSPQSINEYDLQYSYLPNSELKTKTGFNYMLVGATIFISTDRAGNILCAEKLSPNGVECYGVSPTGVTATTLKANSTGKFALGTDKLYLHDADKIRTFALDGQEGTSITIGQGVTSFSFLVSGDASRAIAITPVPSTATLPYPTIGHFISTHYPSPPPPLALRLPSVRPDFILIIYR